MSCHACSCVNGVCWLHGSWRPSRLAVSPARIAHEHSPHSPWSQVLVDGQLVESCLPGSVAEHLNAELVLGTVKDVASAVSWLHTTFLYQRAMRSPGHYG